MQTVQPLDAIRLLSKSTRAPEEQTEQTTKNEGLKFLRCAHHIAGPSHSIVCGPGALVAQHDGPNDGPNNGRYTSSDADKRVESFKLIGPNSISRPQGTLQEAICSTLMNHPISILPVIRFKKVSLKQHCRQFRIATALWLGNPMR